MRKELVAGAASVGAALIGGAALYYVREKQTEEPDYRALATDGPQVAAGPRGLGPEIGREALAGEVDELGQRLGIVGRGTAEGWCQVDHGINLNAALSSPHRRLRDSGNALGRVVWRGRAGLPWAKRCGNGSEG